MPHLRIVKGLLLHFLPNGYFGTIRIPVLFLAGNLGSGNGSDGFRGVHTLLYQRKSLPFDYELLEHDWICFKSERELKLSWVLTVTQ